MSMSVAIKSSTIYHECKVGAKHKIEYSYVGLAVFLMLMANVRKNGKGPQGFQMPIVMDK